MRMTRPAPGGSSPRLNLVLTKRKHTATSTSSATALTMLVATSAVIADVASTP